MVGRARAGRTLRWLMCVLWLGGPACGRSPRPEDDPAPAASVIVGEIFTLRVGEHAEVLAEPRLELTLITVLEDSRCPVGAVCAWEGSARVRVRLRAGEAESGPLDLNTNAQPSSARFGEYSIHLTGLEPHPREGAPIPQELYAARLRVTHDR